jgi:DNA polymerase-3 subunit gamma/tau
LLKTLEEAPGHVVFVLATTNPERVLPTIRSRTQHLEFTLISTDDLVARLALLCEREGVAADPEALAVIASAAAGSARDAESLLDQALAHGADRLDAGAVGELFGGTAFEARLAILEAIAGEDATGALVGLSELLESGHEPRRVAEDLLSAARDAFLLTAARGRVSVAVPAESERRLEQVGESLGNAALVRVIETLGQAIADMRGVEAADPRLVLEVALVRLSRREAGPPIQTVIERIERLERAQASRTDTTSARPDDAVSRRSRRPTVGALRRETDATNAESTAVAEPERAPAGGVSPPAASDAMETERAPAGGVSPPAASDAREMDLDDVILAWAAIVPELTPATRSAVQNAQPVRCDGDLLVFGVAPELLGAARERFKREADTVREALAAKLGQRFKFNLIAEPSLSISMASLAAGGDTPPAGARSAAGAREDSASPEPVALPTDESPSMSRLREELGATVVEELPREA